MPDDLIVAPNFERGSPNLSELKEYSFKSR